MSVLDRFRLDNKRLFITGGSRGLGREMALAIAEAGADVVLVGRDADSLARTSADIRAIGRQAWPLQADAADAGTVRACMPRRAGARSHRHPDQQHRWPAHQRADRGAIAGRLAADDGSEPDQHLPLHQAHRRRDAGARRGWPRHQHRLDQRPDRQSRHRRPPLRNGEGRGDPVHPCHRGRLGAPRRDGERHPARRLHDRAQPALGA